jgi:hypothetical protein
MGLVLGQDRKAGAKITTATWSGEYSQAEFAAAVSSMEAHDTAINYAAFKEGTRTPSPASVTGSWISPCRRGGAGRPGAIRRP